MQLERPLTIILADEHGMLRDGLAAYLRTEISCEIRGTFMDGESALRAIHEFQPDIAVMDFQLSGVFALDIVRRIRQEGCPTKAIMMSARRDRRAAVEALRAGASGFVLKTEPARQLVDAIEQVMGGAVYVSPEIAPGDLFARHRKASLADPVEALSAREYQVYSLLVEGVRAKDIAARLHLSPKTVDTYRASMMRKLDIHDLAGLVRFAIRREASGPEAVKPDSPEDSQPDKSPAWTAGGTSGAGSAAGNGGSGKDATRATASFAH